jgi:Tannase-like family of unknown function (DUF6351)
LLLVNRFSPAQRRKDKSMRFAWKLVATLLLAGASAAAAVSVSAGATLAITTLSSRPDMVSGGDALVRVDVPPSLPMGHIVIKLNGQDITATFHPDAVARTLTGLVGGLALGSNDLEAFVNPTGNGQPAARLTLVNHPIEGPIFSGSRQAPFICQTQSFKLPDGTFLGPPTDMETCSASTVVQYVYESTAGGPLKPMPDTATLPADVAMTTTDSGVTMPFVVRVETGTMDRGIYQNAVLHDPTSEPPPTPFAPPKGWNRRLQALHGVGCPGGWYIQGAAMGENILGAALNVQLLGRGFGIFINTLNHPSNSCNAFLAGEVTSMGKEHFIKTFGAPYYTVSRGCSGGSYSSEQVADAFPGLLDGILIDCTFPDPFAIAYSAQDAHLLDHYFTVTNPTGFTLAEQAAVSGYANTTTMRAAGNQSQRTDPVPGRVDVPGYSSAVWNAAVPVALRYDPVTNPTGARPTVFDENANVFGKDPATGFALRSFDNVGVQYGLAALNAGIITTAQFLDLNEAIGGYDQDENYIPQRTVGDAGAIKRAYESGLNLGGGGGMASIPVFDFTGIYSENTTNYHLQWEHFATRERMREENGNADNHVMWRAIPATIALDQPARVVFDQWMEAYKADTSNLSQRQKVIADKPSGAVDGCFTDATTFVAEPQTFSNQPTTTCNALMPSYAFPRYVAGGPLSASILKCQLKPIDPSDYAVTFTAAEMARLQTIFPSGVCDWSKPGVNQVRVLPWPTSPATGVIDLTPCVAGYESPDGLCLPPMSVDIVPQAINLRGGNGLVTAILTAAPGFDLSQWTLSGVTLNGAPAVSTALSADGTSYVATFTKAELSGLSAGNSIILTVGGTLTKNGTGDQGQFVATDSVKAMQ